LTTLDNKRRKPSTVEYTPKRDLTIERTHKIEFLETGQAALSRRIGAVRHAFVATMLEPHSTSDRAFLT
jgi:hypothetical protein